MGRKLKCWLLVKASQKRDFGRTVHERLKQPQHGSCRRLGKDVSELLVGRDMLEVDEAKSKRIPNEIRAE